MQALWSRAAPGTCKCLSCISSNTTAVARRASAVGNKQPWAFGTPTSTFVYTAIFAAGLSIDAKAKQRRNNQWDEAFDLLRQEIEKPQTWGDVDTQSQWQKQPPKERAPIREKLVDGESISILDGTLKDNVFPSGLDWDIVCRVAGTELWEHKKFDKRQAAVDIEHISKQMWHLLAYDSRFPSAEALEWPANTGDALIRHYLPPQSLWSPDEMRRKALSKRQTWKKLLLQELSIGYLIHDLLDPAYALSDHISEDALKSLSPTIQDILALGPSESKDRRFELLKNIASIQYRPVDTAFEEITGAKRSARSPDVPQYTQDVDGDFYYICQQMNAAMKRTLFGEGDSLPDESQAPITLAKVCHNLLVSSSAPDAQTFNILISGLARWGLPDLVENVVVAFYRCRVRPNEITCVAILDHYIQCNRPDDFSRFVAKMRGVHGGGLMLANPTISVNERGTKRLIRVNQEKVIQKVYPTPLVFNTLMLGALKFAGGERALEIYYEMKTDGWGLDITGLHRFLDDCISRADWNNGILIWREILSIITRIKPAQKETAYSKMLSLCSVTGNTVAFNQLLHDVVEQGLDRKILVKSALATVQKLHEQPDFVAPPFTADNVLFAIGEYMDDLAKEEVITEKEPIDFDQNYHSQQESQPRDSSVQDPDAAWSSWAEQELKQPIGQDASPQQTPSSEELPVKDPDAAWSAWLEQELPAKTDAGSTEKPDTNDDRAAISNKTQRRRRKR